MNKEQIIALLKQKFQGMRADTLDVYAGAILVAADNEEEVVTLIAKATEDKLKDYERNFRSKVDSEVTKAVQTTKSKLELDKPKEEIVEPKGFDPETIKNIVLEAVRPLNEKISLLEGTQVLKNRQSQLDSLLKDCKDDNYKKTITETFNYMNTINDEDFGKWTATVTEGVKNANQNLANESLSRQGAPINPNTYGEKGLEKATIEAITKGETSTVVEGKPLIPTK
jgi:hypothetical protein